MCLLSTLHAHLLGDNAIERYRKERDAARAQCDVLAQNSERSCAHCEKSKSSLIELKSKYECNVCMERDISVYYTACGHATCCVQCAKVIKFCPMCNGPSEYAFLYM